MFRWLLLVLVGQGAAEDVSVQTGTPRFTVRGVLGDGGDHSVFYGIPFSAKRTPPHRFEPPEDPVHIEGEIYNATDPKERCVQKKNDTHVMGSEDCLYLDVYTPWTPGATHPVYPVLVWIHGGAWQSGSKNDYSGVLWASQSWTADVDRAVVVTVNYRMHIWGFPTARLAEAPYNVTKNLGLRDTIQALKWVNRHIEDFSGNKSQITIFGESAGAMNVMLLWASPAARGLFHRAISQSPFIWNYAQGTATPNPAQLAGHETNHIACLETAIGAACGGDTENCAVTAQNVPYDHMRDVEACTARWYGPVVEDGLISATFHRDLCGTMDVGAGVPLLVGFNALEINYWQFLFRYEVKRDQMKGWVQHLAPFSDGPSVFQCLGDLYRASGRMQDPFKPFFASEAQTPENVYATSGVFFNIISQTLAQLPDVYMFMFNEEATHKVNDAFCGETPYGGNPLGAHACEVPFVITHTYYPNGTHMDGLPDMDAAVQRNMRRVWATFAKHGKPGWNEWEVGVFEENAAGEHVVDVRDASAAFIPGASELLNKLMCHPASIARTCPIPETRTCADVKRMFKRNHCCGNPAKTFVGEI